MTDSYIALDLETTGLEPKKEKITEIAALKVEHGQITGRFVTLVNPKRPLTERVVELTGITDDMLKRRSCNRGYYRGSAGIYRKPASFRPQHPF